MNHLVLCSSTASTSYNHNESNPISGSGVFVTLAVYRFIRDATPEVHPICYATFSA